MSIDRKSRCLFSFSLESTTHLKYDVNQTYGEKVLPFLPKSISWLCAKTEGGREEVRDPMYVDCLSVFRGVNTLSTIQ